MSTIILSVMLRKVVNMPPSDFAGLSNVFCTVAVGSSRLASSIRFKTREPTWDDENLNFHLNPADAQFGRIRFTVILKRLFDCKEIAYGEYSLGNLGALDNLQETQVSVPLYDIQTQREFGQARLEVLLSSTSILRSEERDPVYFVDDDEIDLELEFHAINNRILASQKAEKKTGNSFKWIRPLEKRGEPKKNSELDHYWVSTCFAPNSYVGERSQFLAPAVTMELDHVYGYRGWDTRGLARYLDDGTILFVAGNLVVRTGKGGATNQQFLYGHEGAIVSMEAHPNGHMCATVADGWGSRGAEVRVWNLGSAHEESSLRHFDVPDVCCVSCAKFSPDGEFIAVAEAGENGFVSILRWRDGECIVHERSGSGAILRIAWKNRNEFVTVGYRHVRFWSLASRSLKWADGVLRAQAPLCTMLCLAFIHDTTVTGSSRGSLYVWKNNVFERRLDAHVGPIHDIAHSAVGLVTCGQDGKVFFWSSSLLDIHRQLVMDQPVRSISYNSNNGHVLVGTKSSIIQVSRDDEQTLMTQGHMPEWTGKDEARAICMHPQAPILVTGDDAGKILFWDLKKKICIANDHVNKPVTACAFNHDGSHLAVGMSDGEFRVLDTSSMAIIETANIANHINQKRKPTSLEVTMFKWSPDSSALAVAGANGSILIFRGNGKVFVFVLNGHVGGVVSLDWSVDASFIRSCSDREELIHWDLKKGKCHENTVTLEKVKWASGNCLYGWDVRGVHESVAAQRASRVVALSVSPDWSLVASGDEHGSVRIHRYPCTSPCVGSVSVLAHSLQCPAAHLAWTPDSSSLVALGSVDHTVIQWNIRGVVDEP